MLTRAGRLHPIPGRRALATLALAAMATAGTVAGPAAAAAAGTPVGCSAAALVAAVTAANGGSGGGTVTLTAGCQYVLTSTNNGVDGGNGLPVVTGTVTLIGNGARIARSTASGTPHFRLLDVASGAALTLTGVTLSGGIADNGRDGGGAIDNHGTLTATGDTFTGNTNPVTSGTSGGAIQNSGTVTVTQCVFTQNVAMEGGALFNQNQASVNQSTFTGNSATIYGGGALLNAYGTMRVTASTFVGNSGPGGGVIDNDTTAFISDSTMVGNTGGSHGGGAVQNFGTITLTTSTVAGNTSPYGANIYNYGSSTLTVSSTVVTAGKSGANCGGTPIRDGGYNLDSASSCGFSAGNHSLSNTDPQLQALSSNGGPTQTMPLTPGGPAVDVIPSSVAGCNGTTDQRGVARPQGTRCDIGAYEVVAGGSDHQPPTTPTGLAATSTAAGAVTFGWNPSTDNVGVAGYTVYRNSSVLGTVAGSTTSYTDTTAVQGTTYSYAVDAFDAAGNRSARSAALSVTVTAPAPPRWVQGAAAGTGSKVTRLSIPVTGAVHAGDLLVGWFGQYDSTGQVSVSDNVNGAWQRGPVSTTFGNGGGDIALFYRPASAAAPAGITVTVTAVAATYLQGTAADYAGVAASGSLDRMVVAKGSGTAVNSGATASVGAGELLFGGLMTGASPGGATATGGLVLHDHTATFSVDDADALTAVAGPARATWTLQNAADWYTVAAVFHPTTGP